MLQDDLIGKEAYTLAGNYLGKIIRVDGKPDAVVRSERLSAIIRVKRFLFSPDLIQIPMEKFHYLEDQKATFDITKQEFKKLQYIYRLERKRLLKAEKERTRVKEDFNKAATDTLGRFKF
ncbi:MAG: hypothetical protein JXA54_00855 [Candidatus Heimdallarchaeota archaeon]|nr:hypothetical protein [Candidatus Heimdallarchaeota archaeon]